MTCFIEFFWRLFSGLASAHAEVLKLWSGETTLRASQLFPAGNFLLSSCNNFSIRFGLCSLLISSPASYPFQPFRPAASVSIDSPMELVARASALYSNLFRNNTNINFNNYDSSIRSDPIRWALFIFIKINSSAARRAANCSELARLSSCSLTGSLWALLCGA